MTERKSEAVKLFFELDKRIKQNMKKCIPEMGITMPQGMVIGVLEHEGEMKITELGSKLGLSNSTVSGIVDRLEKQTIVERIRSNEDKRIVYVRLQPHFAGFHKKFREEIEKTFEKMLDKGSEEEIEKIIEGFNILLKIINSNYEE
jgi:Transcriptional regulators